MRGEKKLGEILVDLRVLTESEVEEVVTALRRRRDNVKFGEMARALGLVREEHILAALAVQLRLFPGIQDLSMKLLLDTLQQPTELVTKEVLVQSPV